MFACGQGTDFFAGGCHETAVDLLCLRIEILADILFGGTQLLLPFFLLGTGRNGIVESEEHTDYRECNIEPFKEFQCSIGGEFDAETMPDFRHYFVHEGAGKRGQVYLCNFPCRHGGTCKLRQTLSLNTVPEQHAAERLQFASCIVAVVLLCGLVPQGEGAVVELDDLLGKGGRKLFCRFLFDIVYQRPNGIDDGFVADIRAFLCRFHRLLQGGFRTLFGSGLFQDVRGLAPGLLDILLAIQCKILYFGYAVFFRVIEDAQSSFCQLLYTVESFRVLRGADGTAQ